MVDVDLARLEQKSEAFSALNPFQGIPALELDDGRSSPNRSRFAAISRKLQPDPPLFGVGALERAMVEMWQRRLELHLLFPIAQAFRHSHPAMKAMETPQIAQWAEANRPRALAAMARFDEALSDRPFIAGERFSIADITGLVALDFTRPARIAIPDELTRLRRWRDALAARPSAKA